MYRPHELICGSRDNHERIHHPARRRFVIQIIHHRFIRRERFDFTLPQSRKTKWLAALERDPYRLLRRPNLLPFIESIRWNQTTPALKRTSECPFLGNPFHLGIDDRSLCPTRLESPLHFLLNQFPVFDQHNRRLLCWCDVVTRRKEKSHHDTGKARREFHVFTRECITTAHHQHCASCNRIHQANTTSPERRPPARRHRLLITDHRLPARPPTPPLSSNPLQTQFTLSKQMANWKNKRLHTRSPFSPA